MKTQQNELFDFLGIEDKQASGTIDDQGELGEKEQ